MKISVFGLGYVGTVTGVCLAKEGHKIMGVDKNNTKIQQLMERKSPIIEPGIEKLIVEVVDNGHLIATSDTEKAIINSDLSLVSVGTYSSADGSANLRSVYQVMDEIGKAIRKKDTFHSVVIRSTVPPGTTSVAMRRIEKVSGKKLGKDFGGGMNPEFLREGIALSDFKNPPFIVIGTEDKKTEDLMRQMYSFLNAPFYVTETRLAELIKYSCNVFHALKVAFANEMGRICSTMSVDGQKLMDIFVKDNILNISQKYLKPGIPFGGSCLPKDLKALVSFAKSKGAFVPLLDSILDSNEIHFAEILKKIESIGCSSIGILGITFKEDTDDLRESPILKLVRCLIDRGYEVCIHDINLIGRKLIGSNKELLDRVLPEYEEIKKDSLKEIFNSELVVITNSQYKNDPVFRQLIDNDNNKILDINGEYKNYSCRSNYYGLCW